jgi:hypothetical protein
MTPSDVGPVTRRSGPSASALGACKSLASTSTQRPAPTLIVASPAARAAIGAFDLRIDAHVHRTRAASCSNLRAQAGRAGRRNRSTRDARVVPGLSAGLDIARRGVTLAAPAQPPIMATERPSQTVAALMLPRPPLNAGVSRSAINQLQRSRPGCAWLAHCAGLCAAKSRESRDKGSCRASA